VVCVQAVLHEKTVSASVLELAASMAAVGLQGTAALGISYIITHNSLLDAFRSGGSNTTAAHDTDGLGTARAV